MLGRCEVASWRKISVACFYKKQTVLFSLALYVTQYKENNDSKHSDIVRTKTLAVCSQTIV